MEADIARQRIASDLLDERIANQQTLVDTLAKQKVRRPVPSSPSLTQPINESTNQRLLCAVRCALCAVRCVGFDQDRSARRTPAACMYERTDSHLCDVWCGVVWCGCFALCCVRRLT